MPAARASWFALPATNDGESEAGIEARLLVPARRGGGAAATGSAPRARRGGGRPRARRAGRASAAARRRRTAKAIGHRLAVGVARQLVDAAGEALLDPLQDEAVGRDQPIAVASAFDARAAGSRC